MNNRQKELLRMLLTGSNNFVHVQELADDLDCSEKTVRNDLDKLETLLEEYSSAELKRKRGSGVCLSINNEDKVELFHRIYQDSAVSDDDRLLEMAYQLLVSDRPLTLANLAGEHFTNTTKVKNDLNRIARWLKDYHLELIPKQRLGHFVRGEELKKRNALANLSELIPSGGPRERRRVLHLFQPYEISTVKKLLRDLQMRYPITLAEGEFESLQIHALIMIKRTRQHSSIFLGETDDDTSVNLESYTMSAWFLKQLEDTLGMSFPEDEYVYFTWHLESCRTTHGGKVRNEDGFVADIVRQMTAQLQRMTMIKFQDDHVLTDGLEIHLASAIHRIRHGLTIRNPMLTDIKKKYAYMFSMVILAVEKMNEAYELSIPEDEAAYLVLHFQASIERMEKERAPVKRGVVVCDLGVGMSHLLQAKLEQSYRGMDILTSISKHELPAFLEKHETDVIISTTDIDSTDIPVIVVSPLLESDDTRRLDQFLQARNQKDTNGEEALAAIRQFLDPDFIYPRMDQEHRFEIVEMLANDLVNQGFSDQKFVHSAMLRERASATAIGGGVAIPHADPYAVRESVISLAVLREPIQWGDEMVSVVFLLAIAKEDQSLTKSLMQTIAGISRNPALVEKLSEAESAADILAVFDQ
ncbi:BglG family transcription antiterminator [Lentibacillus sediminis]|uniref:BglG family transcription antiterminator n=1 Tax=Lentibacillus sediminis TaxID=1940529 RepID=UPI000C1BA657|nr:BglG family transcription antiterminator [Lentibacillus sediminis]